MPTQQQLLIQKISDKLKENLSENNQMFYLGALDFLLKKDIRFYFISEKAKNYLDGYYAAAYNNLNL